MRRDGAGVEGRWGLAESRRALQSSEGPSVSPRGLSEEPPRGGFWRELWGQSHSSPGCVGELWMYRDCLFDISSWEEELCSRRGLGRSAFLWIHRAFVCKMGSHLSRVKCALVPVLGRRSLSAACRDRGPRVDKGGDHRTLVSLMANFRYFRNSK